jgi:hypothetical protein
MLPRNLYEHDVNCPSASLVDSAGAAAAWNDETYPVPTRRMPQQIDDPGEVTTWMTTR